MLKIIPSRVGRVFEPKYKPFKGSITAASVQRTVQPIVQHTSEQFVNNGVLGKILTSMAVAVAKSVKNKLMPAVEKKVAPEVEKQGSKTIKTLKTGSEHISKVWTGFTQKVVSKFNGFAKNVGKSEKKQSKNILNNLQEFSATTKIKSSIKKFSNAGDKSEMTLKKISDSNVDAVSTAPSKKTSVFDKLFKKEKNTAQKNYVQKKNLVKNEPPKETYKKINATQGEKTPKAEKFAKEPKVDKKELQINKKELLEVSDKPEQKNPFANNKDTGNKPVKSQKYNNSQHSAKSDIGKNPFGKIKSVESEKPQVAVNSGKVTIQKSAIEPSQVKMVTNPFTEELKSQANTAVSNNTTRIVKEEIKFIKARIKVAEKSNQNTEVLKAELTKKEKMLAKDIKSAKKKQVKTQTKKYKKLSKNNYVGKKSFASIKGKGGLFKKQQYSPDGKLERTIINKGNGLIEIIEADSNKSYYMRNGKVIAKLALEEQKDIMQQLAYMINNVEDKAQVQGLVHSYAKRCGMEKVSKTIMIDGQSKKIIYEGFGYSITSDGMVLSKKYSLGNNVFYSNMSSDFKGMQSKKRA